MRRAALTLFILGAACGSKPEPKTGPLSHGVYVWQRAWNQPVVEAVADRLDAFGLAVVLAAEVTFDDARRPRVAWAALDHKTLASPGAPITFAIRVGTGHRPDTNAPLTTLAVESITRMRKAHIKVAGVQIDFDAATADLADYAAWLKILRKRLKPLKVELSITALPTWMTSPVFKDVLAHVDYWVLQVHSLQPPKAPTKLTTLCDPATARQAVGRAATYDTPFWVALPTYGYRVGFAPDGHYLGVQAEQRRVWPPGTTTHTIRADAVAMKGLLDDWTTRRPSVMQGVMWYRLPIDGEQLNWRWTTLAELISHRTVAADLKVLTTMARPGLVDVSLTNHGTADARVRPVELTLAAPPLAMDALRGFRVAAHGNTVRFEADSRDVVQPGETIPVGWVRKATTDATPPTVRLQ